MRHTSRTIIAALFACACAAGANVAHAQEAEVVEGPGVKVGEGYILHPTAGAETGIISNLFYEDGSDNPITTTGILRIIGQVDIASQGNDDENVAEEMAIEGTEGEGEGANAPAEPTAPKLEFRAGLRLDYEEYLSGSEFARSQRSRSTRTTAWSITSTSGCATSPAAG
jgi:hypothetical protein